MHIVLVGPGALGGLLTTLLTDGLQPHDRLTVLDHNRERAHLLNRRGIHYTDEKGERRIPVNGSSSPETVPIADALLVCVKSYDLESCLEFCRPLFHEQLLVLFFQNGIGHLEIRKTCSPAVAAFGSTTEGATLIGPGAVRHGGRGITSLGFLDTVSPVHRQTLDKLAARLAAGGCEIQQTESILNRLWAKLFINVGINALTVVENCKNGELLERPHALKRMEAAVGEALRVAQTRGIEVMDDPLTATRIVCRRTAANVSSMLQDIRNGKRTEIEGINGAIVNLGRKLGIPTPENERLRDEVLRLEGLIP